MNVLLSISWFACVTCNQSLRDKIFDSTFLPNIFFLLSAFIILAIIVAFLSYLSTRKHSINSQSKGFQNPVPFTTASIVIGIGIGGFIDGIFLHQLLQWHEMISNKLPPDTLLNKSVNMFWDGVFHFFSLIVVIVGLILFWKLLFRTNINRSGWILTGGFLVGWGLFNIVEGIIDHHILKIHNIREITNNPDLWNYSFLGFSVVLIIIGYFLIRKSQNSLLEQTTKSTTFG